ncbi:hypothetical protein KAR91_31855 [Candidatus Pacearchaeota archaeon]|nr:hypothetical protein [Candidatus Pacearchaeota archaeon]
MKKLIGVFSLVVLMVMMFTASMAEAGVYNPKIQKLYLEGANQIEGNVVASLDTPREWDLNAVFKADMFELGGLATIGTRIDVSYTPDNSFDSVGIATEVYVKPFGLKYIEFGARHNEQNVSDLDFNNGYAAFFRVGIGI